MRHLHLIFKKFGFAGDDPIFADGQSLFEVVGIGAKKNELETQGRIVHEYPVGRGFSPSWMVGDDFDFNCYSPRKFSAFNSVTRCSVDTISG